MWKLSVVVLLLLCAPSSFANSASAKRVNPEHLEWIASMKSAERGPFSRIRWFCEDGQVLPPTPYACGDFGGGAQHGQWSERTRALRDAGYVIANFYADLDIEDFVKNRAESAGFQQMLIEQFLLRVDDGWILRRALFYRGAFQEEGERNGARKLLLKLVTDPAWIGHRFLLLRTATSLLPHGAETASVQEIRQLSASLSDRDPSFKPLRNKIHGSPELSDAAAVKAYAEGITDDALDRDYARLVGLIEQVYAADIADQLRTLAAADEAGGNIRTLADTARESLQDSGSARARFSHLARTLSELRLKLAETQSSQLRLVMLDTSGALESELFTAATALEQEISSLPRIEYLSILNDALLSVFGAGMLSERQLGAAQASLLSLIATPKPTVEAYKRTLDYLALVPNWGTQRLRRFFGEGMDKLAEIEPKANLYIQDHLRGSPMFFYANLVERLGRDANKLAGVSNELFGADVGASLRSLNPGLARGPLRLALADDVSQLDTNGIYLLPETVSELPPVAGILTAGEGNPLSHVQLLARNLGIPNVSIDTGHIETLKQREGETVLLAVSPAGSVRLSANEAEIAEAFPDTERPATNDTLIKVDLNKLDLERREFLSLSQLRADDSGRVVGPKAAKLGELKYHYPDAVAEGLTIPFGIFRDLLAQPKAGTATTIFDWMQTQYAAIAELPVGSEARGKHTEIFRAELQKTILNSDPGDAFKQRLRDKLIAVFGADRSFGVFVRSDTNVEDLPGFTGAGLNLTVPNVVGIDNIIAAVSRVWASPFSARSFAWRQSLMDKPEHVYPAVLLMLSVDAEKSGVLVTRDIDSGDPSWLSVAVNEGVGGAVDGQSAESLRIDTVSGKVRLMAQATASIRRQVDLNGGVSKLSVSTAERVLTDSDIEQLIKLAQELPSRFPAVVDANGRATPADIEFGFLDGELRLFQIRPFLDSDRAGGNEFLRRLDAPLANLAGSSVALDETL